jgi:hypothetical protein
LNIGHVAELGRAAQERREIALEIVEQAKAKNGIYSPTRHLDNLIFRADGGETSDRAHDIVDNAERLAERWAGKPDTGITQSGGGDYAVDVPAFEKFMGRQASREAVTGMTDATNVTLERGRDLDLGR